MAEMTALEYLTERSRMTKNCDINCAECPFAMSNNAIGASCVTFEALYSEKAIAIVQKWSQEHPRKTMMQDLLEKFPELPLHSYGVPMTCPWVIGYSNERCGCKMAEDYVKCWNRPLEE